MAAPIYTDFNILWQNKTDLKGLLSLAIELGYERVAINNFITDLTSGKKQKDKVPIASPCEIKLSEKDLKSLQKNGRKFEQLSRITALLVDVSNTHRLSSPEVQAYDILSVQPTDEKTFQLACSTLEVDIITFDFSEPLGFPLKRPLLKLAAERGVHFEICYSRAFQDSSVKRLILSNAMNLVDCSKGKAINLRSPYDVINLSKILGFNHVQAKNSITKNSRAVIMHAASRKSSKSVVSASLASQLPSKDRWVLDAHKKLMEASDSEEVVESSEEDSEEEPKKKKQKI